jgi:hypothetical protein
MNTNSTKLNVGLVYPHETGLLASEGLDPDFRVAGGEPLEIFAVTGKDVRAACGDRLGDDQRIHRRRGAGAAQELAGAAPDLFRGRRDGADGVQNSVHRSIAGTAAKSLG